MQLFIIAIFLLLARVAQAQNLPFPIAPPLDLQSYAGECPGRGQVLNAAQGTITINCPNTTFDCSQFPGHVLRGFGYTENLDWYLHFINPTAVNGTISVFSRDGLGCYVQPGNTLLDLWTGEPFDETPAPPITACYWSAKGCTAANRIYLAPHVTYAIQWEFTDGWQEADLQLTGILIGH
jgi:hypothetical protein